MEDVVHGTSGALDRFLKRLHGARHMFFKGIADQHVIFFWISVVGAGARNVVDPFLYVVFTTGAARRVLVGIECRSSSACARSRSLLREQSRTGHEGCYRRDLAKEIPSSVFVHSSSPSVFFPERKVTSNDVCVRNKLL